MQTMVVVAALQRVPALAVVVESSRARDQEGNVAALPVVESLDEVPPPGELVDFVEYQQVLAGRQLPSGKIRTYKWIVPIEIRRMPAIVDAQ